MRHWTTTEGPNPLNSSQGATRFLEGSRSLPSGYIGEVPQPLLEGSILG